MCVNRDASGIEFAADGFHGGHVLWAKCVRDPIDIKKSLVYSAFRNGGVAKLVIAPACQAGDRGFKSRRSRYFFCSASFERKSCYTHHTRAVAQRLARLVRDQEAGGSNPPSPTIDLRNGFSDSEVFFRPATMYTAANRVRSVHRSRTLLSSTSCW
jgi:hypothetical protein